LSDHPHGLSRNWLLTSNAEQKPCHLATGS
jgi:hypothetical protein